MFENDKWFHEQSPEVQRGILANVEKGMYGASKVDDVGYGFIQMCPQCKEIRVTGCCACGCGHCLTCNYRFFCRPVPIVDATEEWDEVNWDIFTDHESNIE